MPQIKPGTPILTLPPETIISEAGDFENDDGVRLVLVNHNLVFLASAGGTQIQFAVSIFDVLDAIQEHDREGAS